MPTSVARPIGIDGGVNSEFDRQYTIKYQVITGIADGPRTALQAPGIPQWGSFYRYNNEVDLWSFAQQYTPRVVETDMRYNFGSGEVKALKWEIDVSYSTRATNRQTQPQRDNPLEEPPKISGSYLSSSRPAYDDKNGAKILNTAGEPYLPAPTVPSDIDTLLISYNTAVISLPQRADYIGSVNSVNIWGLEPRQARLVRWGYTVAYAGSMPYIQHKFEFNISFQRTPTSNICIGNTYAGKKGWYTILPNEGLSALPAVGKPPIRVTDGRDIPAPAPVKLKCDGTRETGANEYWNVYAIEKERNFLQIPGMLGVLPGPFV